MGVGSTVAAARHYTCFAERATCATQRSFSCENVTQPSSSSDVGRPPPPPTPYLHRLSWDEWCGVIPHNISGLNRSSSRGAINEQLRAGHFSSSRPRDRDVQLKKYQKVIQIGTIGSRVKWKIQMRLPLRTSRMVILEPKCEGESFKWPSLDPTRAGLRSAWLRWPTTTQDELRWENLHPIPVNIHCIRGRARRDRSGELCERNWRWRALDRKDSHH